MKYYIFSLFLFIFFLQHAGQSQNIVFGLKGGINRSMLDNEGSDYEMFEARIGYRAGVHALLNVKNRWNLRTEILYSSDGAKFKGSDKYYLKLSNISIPILLNYQFAKWFNVEVGPEFNYTISQDSQWIFGEFSVDKKFDYGISAGFELKPIDILGLSLRYNQGLRYRDELIFRDSNNNFQSSTKLARSSVLSASINYYFNRGKL